MCVLVFWSIKYVFTKFSFVFPSFVRFLVVVLGVSWWFLGGLEGGEQPKDWFCQIIVQIRLQDAEKLATHENILYEGWRDRSTSTSTSTSTSSNAPVLYVCYTQLTMRDFVFLCLLEPKMAPLPTRLGDEPNLQFDERWMNNCLLS